MSADFLYKPMNVSGNVDERYFKPNDDGTYNLTPLMIHNIARDASAYFKQRIFDLDENNQYHTASLQEVKDTWAEKEHNMQWKIKYGDKTKEATKLWHQYRDEHPDEFETKGSRVSLGGEDEVRFFNGYSPDINCGLAATVKAYNALRVLAAKYGKGGSEYDNLPKEEPLYSKAEFAQEHKAIRQKISQQLGIPDDDFVVGTVQKVVNRINNKKCAAVGEDDSILEDYVNGLIKHLTSTTAQEFIKHQKECHTFIDADFAMDFNDKCSQLKAETSLDDFCIIEIYTKPTEYRAPERIITIYHDNPGDPYKYCYRGKSTFIKYISTKADLRKALEETIEFMGDDYKQDLLSVIESL